MIPKQMIDVAKDDLIDAKKACKALGNVSYQTFVGYVRSGDLEAVKRRGSWLTTYAAINAYLHREAQEEIDKEAARTSATTTSAKSAASKKRLTKKQIRNSPAQREAANNLRSMGLI